MPPPCIIVGVELKSFALDCGNDGLVPTGPRVVAAPVFNAHWLTDTLLMQEVLPLKKYRW
jgi:hypothetical protein